MLADIKRQPGKYPRWRIPFELARVLKEFSVDSPVEFEGMALWFFENLGLDPFDCWVRFLICWDLVRCPAGEDAWDLAVKAAWECPLAISPNPGHELAILAAVAGYLDAARPGEPFVFSLPRIVKSFGRSKMTASRAVQALVQLRIIEVADGKWSYKEGKARTFRFVGSIQGSSE